MMNIDAKTLDLAKKFRKDATSSFTHKDYAAVLGLLGWTMTEEKEGRTVRAAVFTSPEGQVVRAFRGPTNTRVLFYKANEEFAALGLADAVSALIGMPSFAEEQEKKVMYGVQYDVNNAGICPACFRLQKLDADGGMVLHGYQRPGDGCVVGRCYGVGLRPLEVSVKGTEAFLNEVLEPRAVRSEKTLAEFIATPPTSLNAERGYGAKKTVVTLTAADGYEFERAMESTKRRLERQASDSRRVANGYRGVVENWVADITPIEREEQGLMPKMIRYIMRCH